jgi:large subunit ribosomal protein L25
MVRPEIELKVTAGDIPEKIVASVEGLNIGDTLTISMVNLPAGSVPTIDRDFVIANIQAPSGLASQADEDEAPAADEVPTTDVDADEE